MDMSDEEYGHFDEMGNPERRRDGEEVIWTSNPEHIAASRGQRRFPSAGKTPYRSGRGAEARMRRVSSAARQINPSKRRQGGASTTAQTAPERELRGITGRRRRGVSHQPFSGSMGGAGSESQVWPTDEGIHTLPKRRQCVLRRARTTLAVGDVRVTH